MNLTPRTSVLRLRQLAWCAAVACFVAPTIALAGSGQGEESPRTPAPLSLEDALAAAQANNPDSKIFESAIDASAGERITASKWRNPELTAVPGIKHTSGSDANGDEFYGEFGISQQVELPKKRRLRVEAAEKGVELSKLGADSFRFGLGIDVRRVFYTLLAAEKVHELRRQQLDAARRFAESVRARLEGGYSSEFDVLKAESEEVASEKLLQESELKVTVNRSRLNTLMGRAPESPLNIDGDLARLSQASPPKEALGRATTENRAYRAAILAAEKAGVQVDAAKLERYPDLTVGPDLEYLKDEQTYKIELSVPLPILNRNEGEIQTATALKRKASAEVDRVRRAIEAAITTAEQTHRNAVKKLELYSPRFLQRLKDLVSRAERGYAENTTPLLIYIDTRRTYYETMVDYYETLGGVATSLADLDAAIGGTPRMDEVSSDEAK